MGTTIGKNLSPGAVIKLVGKLYRVEANVKVTVGKGNPFIKVSLRNLTTDKLVERNFKTTQKIDLVALNSRNLEFLYPEEDYYLFMDIDNLEMVKVPLNVVGDRSSYLKEGVGVKASFYGDTIFSIELPQFLEVMIVRIEDDSEEVLVADVNKTAVLESGATVEVPQFIKVGEIVKVDTTTGEYIQRV